MKPKKAATDKFDLKQTGPFTPKEAAARLKLASEQLKNFQLWHPEMHGAHDDFYISEVKYPISSDALPAGVLVSTIDRIGHDAAPPPNVSGLMRPFRNAQVLAQIAKISFKVIFCEIPQRECRPGIHSFDLESEPGKGMRLRAYNIHNLVTGLKPPEEIVAQIVSALGVSVREGWVLAETYEVMASRVARRLQSTVEKSFPAGELDEVEQAVKEILAREGKPRRAEWSVGFGNTFYRRVCDEVGRSFYFPDPELLKATGLKGSFEELIALVNAAGFPGVEAEMRFSGTFGHIEDALAYFELAARAEKTGERLGGGLLAMFQTEKGVFAQFFYDAKRDGRIFLKVLYPQRQGFGWEDAYAKLLRGEKLISQP